MNNKLIFIFLDGFGLAPTNNFNPLSIANMPFTENLFKGKIILFSMAKKTSKKKAAKKELKKSKFSRKQKVEQREAWMRIPIAIVSGIILDIWGFFIFIFAIVQLILVLVEGKKEKELYENHQQYASIQEASKPD